MVDSAALLVDEVLPEVPLRQWVLSVPFQLRFLFASYPALMGKALGVVTRSITSWLIQQAGFTHDTARTGAVTFIQRFGSALNLNVHLTCMDAPMPRAHGCAGAAHHLPHCHRAAAGEEGLYPADPAAPGSGRRPVFAPAKPAYDRQGWRKCRNYRETISAMPSLAITASAR